MTMNGMLRRQEARERLRRYAEAIGEYGIRNWLASGGDMGLLLNEMTMILEHSHETDGGIATPAAVPAAPLPTFVRVPDDKVEDVMKAMPYLRKLVGDNGVMIIPESIAAYGVQGLADWEKE